MIGYCRNDGYLGCFGQEALHELTGVYVTLPQHDLLNMNTFSSETVCDDGVLAAKASGYTSGYVGTLVHL